jgi:hypothetical protein
MGQRKRSKSSRQQDSSEKRDMRSTKVIPVTTQKLVQEIKKRLRTEIEQNEKRLATMPKRVKD